MNPSRKYLAFNSANRRNRPLLLQTFGHKPLGRFNLPASGWHIQIGAENQILAGAKPPHMAYASDGKWFFLGVAPFEFPIHVADIFWVMCQNRSLDTSKHEKLQFHIPIFLRYSLMTRAKRVSSKSCLSRLPFQAAMDQNRMATKLRQLLCSRQLSSWLRSYL